jgi:hypothetical protein
MHVHRRWRSFFTLGFGPGTNTVLDRELKAGSRQDGTPSEQLIILPPVQLGVERNG